MEYRQLDNSGVRVPIIGMGTNQFGRKVDQEGVNSALDAALDQGINFINTADVYADAESDRAAKRGRSMVELAYAWLLAQPQICSVISGLTRLEHLKTNAQAADWRLNADDLSEIESILTNRLPDNN